MGAGDERHRADHSDPAHLKEGNANLLTNSSFVLKQSNYRIPACRRDLVLRNGPRVEVDCVAVDVDGVAVERAASGPTPHQEKD